MALFKANGAKKAKGASTMMVIDQEIIAGYLGGDVAVINFDKSIIYQGPISGIEIEDDVITVKCYWIAQSTSCPNLNEWFMTDKKTHTIDLRLFDVSLPGFGRLCLQSLATQEIIIFFQDKDAQRIDSNRVKNFAQAM